MKYTVRNNHHRIGKMAQQLKVYAALAEDPHLIQHTHRETHNSIIPLPGDLTASFGLPRYLPSYIHTPKTNVKLNKHDITTPELTVVLFGNKSLSNPIPSLHPSQMTILVPFLSEIKVWCQQHTVGSLCSSWYHTSIR